MATRTLTVVRFWKKLFWQFVGGLVLTIVSLIFFNLWLINTERKIDNLQDIVAHQTETAYAFGIGSLKASAMTLEAELLKTREEKKLLIQCIADNNCNKFPELLVERELPRYESPAEIYKTIEAKMTKRFEDLEKPTKGQPEGDN